jgi:hypothetical protein
MFSATEPLDQDVRLFFMHHKTTRHQDFAENFDWDSGGQQELKSRPPCLYPPSAQ